MLARRLAFLIVHRIVHVLHAVRISKQTFQTDSVNRACVRCVRAVEGGRGAGSERGGGEVEGGRKEEAAARGAANQTFLWGNCSEQMNPLALALPLTHGYVLSLALSQSL